MFGKEVLVIRSWDSFGFIAQLFCVCTLFPSHLLIFSLCIVTVGEMGMAPLLKSLHTQTPSLLAFRQDIYFSGGLFQRQSISMVMAAHRSGRMRGRRLWVREGARKRRFQLVSHYCTLVDTHRRGWYVFIQVVNGAVTPSLQFHFSVLFSCCFLCSNVLSQLPCVHSLY